MEHQVIDSPRPSASDRAYGPVDDGRALQDRLAVHCFGCGTLNAHGLHIKSRWQGDELVCVWHPRPEHVGFPGSVYGGTIASVVDCHAVWAALSLHCREAGHDMSGGPPPFGVVTGSSNSNTSYVDVTGYGVMRIATITSNTVFAYAISPDITDPHDSRLRLGQVARLVAWN